MSDDSFDKYRGLEFMQSRIPVQDGLSIFVPDGEELSDSARRQIAEKGASRWYPVSGGHRVLVPYEGQRYDPAEFALEQAAWDHETCDHCRTHIPAMTLCWVTKAEVYWILCANCKAEMDQMGEGI